MDDDPEEGKGTTSQSPATPEKPGPGWPACAPPRLKVGAKAKSESAAKPRKRRKARANSESEESFVHEESSDDENGMADFIVDDDDEISEEDPSSGEEDMETFMSITGMKRTSIPPSRLRSDGGSGW